MAICIAQIVTAAVAFPFVLSQLAHTDWPRRLLLFAHVVVYGAVGSILFFIGHRETRARLLGALLLFTATVFANTVVKDSQQLSGVLLAPLIAAYAIRVDALTPYVIWRFVSDFPRVPDSRNGQAWMRFACRTSGVLSGVLIAANLAVFVLGTSGPTLSVLARNGAHSAYFQLQYVVAAIAFVVLVVRSRRAVLDEQRRVALLIWALVAGTAPTVLWIVLWSIIPGFDRWVPLRLAGWIIYPALLTVPILTGYAVVVRQALGVAVILRRVVEHTLSRNIVLIVAASPVVFLFVELYRHRADRIGDTVSTSNGLILAALFVASVASLRGRRTLLDRIDRLFFRERYDARHVTAQLIEECRWTATRGDLATILTSGLDRALHLNHVAVLLLDSVTNRLEDPRGSVQSLPVDSRLLAFVRSAEEGVDVDALRSRQSSLSTHDLEWIVDSRIRYLFPLHDAEARVVGLIVLGDKRSELPFSRDDRGLVAAVGASAELTIAYYHLCDPSLQQQINTPQESLADRLASECPACGWIGEGTEILCERCAHALVESLLPRVIHGKLRVTDRLGTGGMGTVYSAIDLVLDRAVALKTLPYHSPDEAQRLRREARVMASVSHLNIAAIYGIESWRGRPVLVCELLSGGTLADRLRTGPLSLDEAIDIGISVGAGLEALHAAGLLHGDIKPSNIGFTSTGVTKLLDFGLSRGFGPSDSPHLFEGRATLAYTARELVAGGSPTFDSDIWSLSLTLYEAISGIQPMRAASLAETRRLVEDGVVPSLSQIAPAVSTEIVSLLDRALSQDATHRLRSARELRSALIRVRAVPTNAL
jgi:heme exporter protein D